MFGELEDKRDDVDDLSSGQVVIIAARWILVGAGLALTLWNASSVVDLQVSILLILGLAAANFFLHAHVLMGRPIPPYVAYAASGADLTVISLVLAVTGGFTSGAYVFYFPALLALSVAFPTRTAAWFTAAVAFSYGVIALTNGGANDGATVLTQMIMLVAVSVCGHTYRRVEQDRRLRTSRISEPEKVAVGS